MARYIDADAAVEEARLAYCKDCNSYNGVMCRACAFDDAMSFIEDYPAADVVPKSEVEDIRRYIILNEDIAIKCKNENGEQNEEYWKGKVSAFRQIRGYIDVELKKKYTEDQT